MYRKGAERALGLWVGWGGVGRGALGSAWSFIHSRFPVLRVGFSFQKLQSHAVKNNNNKMLSVFSSCSFTVCLVSQGAYA